MNNNNSDAMTSPPTNFSVGMFLDYQWHVTVSMYPHLSIVDDDNFKHAIIQCASEEAQNNVLDMFLKKYPEKQVKNKV